MALIFIEAKFVENSELECPPELLGIEDGQLVTIYGKLYQIEDKVDYTNLYIYLKSGTKVIIMDVNDSFIEIGNTIQVTGNLMEYDVARNPGNFNAKEYYQNQGIYASLYSQKVEIIDSTKDRYQQYLCNIKRSGIETLYSALGETNGGLLAAIIFGDKSGMEDTQKERFQKVGISHIFAISGLHISLLCMAAYQFIRKKTGSFLIGALLGSIILFSYISITGISTSAIRAGIMFVIRVMGDVAGRVYDTRTSLGIAGVVVLARTSTYLFDGAYLLSFGAILGVVYLVPILQIILKKYGVVGKMIGASLGIQIVLLPIMLQNFFEVCLYSTFINLLVIPCMPVLLVSGLIGLSTYNYIRIIGEISFGVCSFLLMCVDKLSSLVLKLPHSRLIVGQIWWPLIILYYIVVIFLILCGNRICEREEFIEANFGEQTKIQKKVSREKVISKTEDKLRGILKREKIVFCMGISLLPFILLIDKPAADLELTMIDVGQGDSIFLEGPTGGTYLIDGGSTDISNVGRYRIESFLLSQGVSKIDYVFISHGDADHYNGIVEMMTRQELGIKINNLVLADGVFWDDKLKNLAVTAQENGVKVLMMAAGNTVTEGELEFVCIAPQSGYKGVIGNASSMVLDVSYKEFDILFTGDLEGEGEKDFILGEYNLKESYEVLKVSHHGSKNSSPLEFLELVEPKICIISAGVNSRYGHPHDELLDRLEIYTDKIWITSQVGAIAIEYYEKTNKVKIKTFLQN